MNSDFIYNDLEKTSEESKTSSYPLILVLNKIAEKKEDSMKEVTKHILIDKLSSKGKNLIS